MGKSAIRIVFFPMAESIHWKMPRSTLEDFRQNRKPRLVKCDHFQVAFFLRLFITWWLTQSSPFSAMALLASFSRHLVLLQSVVFSFATLGTKNTQQNSRMMSNGGSGGEQFRFFIEKNHQPQLHVFFLKIYTVIKFMPPNHKVFFFLSKLAIYVNCVLKEVTRETT